MILQNEFYVYSVNDTLPAPSEMYAQFMDDGVNVGITFNVPTNLGLHDLGIIFNCNEMFEFQGREMNSFECVWLNNAQIKLSPHSYYDDENKSNDTSEMMKIDYNTSEYDEECTAR